VSEMCVLQLESWGQSDIMFPVCGDDKPQEVAGGQDKDGIIYRIACNK